MKQVVSGIDEHIETSGHLCHRSLNRVRDETFAGELDEIERHLSGGHLPRSNRQLISVLEQRDTTDHASFQISEVVAGASQSLHVIEPNGNPPRVAVWAA